MVRRLVVLSGGLLVTLWVAGAAGQESSSEPVLHEYFDPAAIDSGEMPSGEGSGGDRPMASGGGGAGPPGLTLQPGAGDRVRGPSGPLEAAGASGPYGPTSPQGGASALDDKTDRVSELDYHGSFEPSVFPYKRGVVQDRPVRTDSGTYAMATSESDFEQLRVEGGSVGEGEEGFWGTFLIRAKSGAFHPIPSVAPNQRYLQLQTEPEVSARIFRDGADNHYLQIDHRGRVRVNVRVAAPSFYLTGTFDDDVDWSAYDPMAGAAEMRPEIRRTVSEVTPTVGVSRSQPPSEVVRQLIYYFRNFETRSLPDRVRTGDLYRTLVESQIGVCRHRSMAFVMTARGLGIPARYVTNEAHAFVEIWWPSGGWRRIDLGGSARDIGYNGGANDTIHSAGERDPFPKPPAFREEMRELREKRDEDGDGADASEPQSSSPGGAGLEGPESGGGGSSVSSESDERASGGGDAGLGESERPARKRKSRRAEDREASNRRPSASGDRASRESHRTAPGRGRSATRLTVEVPEREVFRGAEVDVQGRLVGDDGAGIGGQKVIVYFGRVGAKDVSSMQQLGEAETDQQGRYRVTVAVPETVGVGRWSLIATFPGNESHAPAQAE